MKHTAAKITTGVVGAGLAGYSIWLWSQGLSVVEAGGIGNTLALIVALFLGVYMIVIASASSLTPKNRRQLAVMGVIAIIVSDIYFVDDPDQMIYLADIMKLVGVFLILIGVMKLLVSKAMQEKEEEKHVEIIEV